jgi:hypothetical protein
MVRVEGIWPISTPGMILVPFNAAVSGSNTGNDVIINRSRPYKASVADLKNLPKYFFGRLYSSLASRSFTNDASKEFDSTLARL